MSERVKTYRDGVGDVNIPIEKLRIVADNCLFVSASFTGYGSPYFTTIAAAITAAAAGDLISVFPGDYAERLIMKTGVNIHLAEGVRICPATGSNDPVFDIIDCEMSITGNGVIDYNPTAADVTAPIRIKGASEVFIELDAINGFVPTVLDMGVNAVQIKGTSLSRLKIRTIESGIEFDEESNSLVEADRVDQRIKTASANSKAVVYTDKWQFIETTAGNIKVFFSETIGNGSKLYIMGGYTELIDGNIEVTVPDGSGSGGLVNSHVSNIFGGILRLKHVRVAVNDLKSQVPCALVTNGTLISDNVTYRSDTANSLQGTGIVKCYGSVSNKIASPTLLWQVDALKVDTNVL